MLQDLLNISYLLSAFFVCATNPIMTTAFLFVLYMRGELTQFFQPFMTGILSLADMSIYIVPTVMIIFLLIGMIKNAAKHPWWQQVNFRQIE